MVLERFDSETQTHRNKYFFYVVAVDFNGQLKGSGMPAGIHTQPANTTLPNSQQQQAPDNNRGTAVTFTFWASIEGATTEYNCWGSSGVWTDDIDVSLHYTASPPVTVHRQESWIRLSRVWRVRDG